MKKQDYNHYVRNHRIRNKDKEPRRQNQKKEEEIQEEEEDA